VGRVMGAAVLFAVLAVLALLVLDGINDGGP
jgi:hypothetical protein